MFRHYIKGFQSTMLPCEAVKLLYMLQQATSGAACHGSLGQDLCPVSREF